GEPFWFCFLYPFSLWTTALLLFVAFRLACNVIDLCGRWSYNILRFRSVLFILLLLLSMLCFVIVGYVISVAMDWCLGDPDMVFFFTMLYFLFIITPSTLAGRWIILSCYI